MYGTAPGLTVNEPAEWFAVSLIITSFFLRVLQTPPTVRTVLVRPVSVTPTPPTVSIGTECGCYIERIAHLKTLMNQKMAHLVTNLIIMPDFPPIAYTMPRSSIQAHGSHR